MIKVLHINYSDKAGGAAIAAYRLHKGLLKIGVDSKVYVRNKLTNDSTVLLPRNGFTNLTNKLNTQFEIFFKRLFKVRSGNALGLRYLYDFNVNEIKRISADLYHIHWINGGFMNLDSLIKLDKPIVWTLHDMWAFCGTEHYVDNYDKYMNNEERNGENLQVSRIDKFIFNKKKNFYKRIQNLSFVTPSVWLGQIAQKSSLLSSYRVNVIPNGLDLNVFRPNEAGELRKSLQIAADKKIVLFGGFNPVGASRKGIDLLKSLIQELERSSIKKNLVLLILGADNYTNFEMAIEHKFLGRISDELEMAKYYSIANMLILPSRQDNLPNMAIEAIACGTPVLAFNIGGLPEIVQHKFNGYLANPFNIKDFASGFNWILNNSNKIKNNCVKVAEENYELIKIAKLYEKLYKAVLKK